MRPRAPTVRALQPLAHHSLRAPQRRTRIEQQLQELCPIPLEATNIRHSHDMRTWREDQ